MQAKNVQLVHVIMNSYIKEVSMKKLIALLITLSFISPAIYAADSSDTNATTKTPTKTLVKKHVADKHKASKETKKISAKNLENNKKLSHAKNISKTKKLAKLKKATTHKTLAADHSAKTAIKKADLPNLQNKETTTAMSQEQKEDWTTQKPTDTNPGFLKNAWNNFISFFR